MSKREQKILIGMFILCLIIGMGVATTWYVTRIIPIQEAARVNVRVQATQRQLERDLDRVMTPDG